MHIDIASYAVGLGGGTVAMALFNAWRYQGRKGRVVCASAIQKGGWIELELLCAFNRDGKEVVVNSGGPDVESGTEARAWQEMYPVDSPVRVHVATDGRVAVTRPGFETWGQWVFFGAIGVVLALGGLWSAGGGARVSFQGLLLIMVAVGLVCLTIWEISHASTRARATHPRRKAASDRGPA